MFLAMTTCLAIFKMLNCLIRLKYSNHDQETIPNNSIIYQKFLDGNQTFNSMIFIPASLFDMIATALNFMGLNLTYASSYQMLNGLKYNKKFIITRLMISLF